MYYIPLEGKMGSLRLGRQTEAAIVVFDISQLPSCLSAIVKGGRYFSRKEVKRFPGSKMKGGGYRTNTSDLPQVSRGSRCEPFAREDKREINMRNKYSGGFALLACVLAVAWLLGATVVAKAATPNPVPVESWNFELLGSVDSADDGTPTKARWYSKIAPWPFTQHTFLNTGCYESGINPAMPGCFRVVDVKDPFHPKRIATVESYDRVKSPLPPVPTDPYWVGKDATNVWKNDAFNNLPFSTSCGDRTHVLGQGLEHAHTLYGGCLRRFSNARSFRPRARSV
jgi:hypothetical protein